jgi:uncharacterized protein with GYD domain
MPKFLIKASYTAEGMKGLKKDKASGREKAVAAALKSLGGKLDGIWYALGDVDVYALIDVPSHVHAAALSTTVGASGLVTGSTTALLTVAEMDQALSETVTFRAPGA